MKQGVQCSARGGVGETQKSGGREKRDVEARVPALRRTEYIVHRENERETRSGLYSLTPSFVRICIISLLHPCFRLDEIKGTTRI